MYGRSFEDLDGHIWEPMWMDMEASPPPWRSSPKPPTPDPCNSAERSLRTSGWAALSSPMCCSGCIGGMIVGRPVASRPSPARAPPACAAEDRTRRETMTYVEGFVLAVPAARKEEFRKHAAGLAPLFRQFGVTRVVEAWGDDVPDGKVTDFKGAVKAEEGETVVFSWFEYPDRATRDAANEKMRSDPRMEAMGAAMPFDGKRMIMGGFTSIVEESAEGAMGYADGFVAPVPEGKKEAYREMAAKAAAVFKEYGATRVVEGWGDDVPDGKVTDFRRAVKAEDGRECRLFLDRMAVEGGPRRRLEEGHGGRADEARLRQHAVRRQAHVLGRLRPDRSTNKRKESRHVRPRNPRSPDRDRRESGHRQILLVRADDVRSRTPRSTSTPRWSAGPRRTCRCRATAASATPSSTPASAASAASCRSPIRCAPAAPGPAGSAISTSPTPTPRRRASPRPAARC